MPGLGLGLGLGRGRGHGSGPSGSTLIMAATASININVATTRTYQEFGAVLTPATAVETTTASGATPIVYTMTGNTDGFAIDADTGQIDYISDVLLLNMAAYNNLGTSFTFTKTATVGPQVKNCTVTVTLDTSDFQSAATPGGTKTWQIPGIDFPAGRTSVNALLDPIVDGLPTGWQIDPTYTFIIKPTTNSPATLEDYDLSAFIIEDGGYTGLHITQCLYDIDGLDPANVAQIPSIFKFTGSGQLMDYCSVHMRGFSNYWGKTCINGGGFTLDHCVIIEAPADVIDINAGTVTNCFLNCVTTAIYDDTSWGTYVTTPYSWNHGDVLQAFGVSSTAILATGNWMDGRVYGTQYHRYTRTNLTGTITAANSDTGIVGSGTSFTTELAVGQWISWLNDGANNLSHGYITAIADDTNLTIAYGGTAQAAVGASFFIDPYPASGVTSAFFLQGNDITGKVLDATMTGTGNILLGGGYVTSVGATVTDLSDTWTANGTDTVTADTSGGNATSALSANNEIILYGVGPTIYTVSSVTDDNTIVFTGTVPAGSGLTLRKLPAIALITIEDNLLHPGLSASGLGWHPTFATKPVRFVNNVKLTDPTTLASANINATPPTPAPTVSEVTESYAVVTWTADSDVTQYFADYSTDGGSNWSSAVATDSSAQHQFTGLDVVANAYTFRITGKNALSEDGVTYLQAGTGGTVAQATVTNVNPTLVSSSPTDGATGINNDATTIALTFSEEIAAGTGNVVVYDDTGAAAFETFNIATGAGDNSGTIAISGKVATITLGASMAYSNAYSIQIDATAVDDLAGNSYAGIADHTTLNWTTGAAPVAVLNVTPTGNGSSTINKATRVVFPTDFDIGPLGEVRITIESASSSNPFHLALNNTSIGKHGGTYADMAAAPVEIAWIDDPVNGVNVSGSHVTVDNNLVQATSAWVALGDTFVAGEKLVINFDWDGTNSYSIRSGSLSSAYVLWIFASGTAYYNTQSPGFGSSFSTLIDTVIKVETR